MALLVFVDDGACKFTTESGVGRRWFGYGGLALQDKQLPAFDRRFETLKDTYEFPARLPRSSKAPSLEIYREVKYNPTNRQWMHSDLIELRRKSFFQDSLKIVKDLGGVFLFSYYDESCDSCGETAAKARALENLYERINAMAVDQESSIGIVICDIEGSRTQVQQLVTRATGIARFGSWFQRNMKTNLYPVLLTADSNIHAGLQIADIAMGSLSNMLRSEATYAPPIWSAVSKSLFIRAGTARGWGLKLRSNDASQIYTRLGVN